MKGIPLPIAAAATLLLAGSAPIGAQPSLPVSGGLIGGLAFRGSHTAAGTVRTSGSAFGVEGSVRLGPAFLDLKYLEGNLSGDAVSAEQDLVEGELLVGVHTTPWLAVKVGLHLRSFVTGAITERWVLWEGRVEATGSLYSPSSQAFDLRSYVEGWMVVSGDASVVDRYDRGLGAEVGMVMRLGRAPLQARLAYRVDHGKLASGARQETVEALILAVGVSLMR